MLLLAKTLLGASALLLLLTLIGVFQALTGESSLPIFQDFQQESRGAIALVSFGSGITAAGILAGLGGILRALVEPLDGS